MVFKGIHGISPWFFHGFPMLSVPGLYSENKKNVAKRDNSNHITCYKRMSNYSLDCTNMLNCNGSCDNECMEFFPNSYMRPAGISTFM